MIEVRDISKSYDKLQVLRQVSIDIPRGEIVAVVGPSGAGKTTLLQIIGTLERPDSGTVKIDGCDVTRLGERRLAAFRNARIGFIFQFHQLLPEFTMLENVMMPALIGGQAYRISRIGRPCVSQAIGAVGWRTPESGRGQGACQLACRSARR